MVTVRQHALLGGASLPVIDEHLRHAHAQTSPKHIALILSVVLAANRDHRLVRDALRF
jgi:hypothetical protein